MRWFKREPPQIPPVPESPYLMLSYAKETDRMCKELWEYVGVPWEWGKWWRLHRVIQARIKAVKQALDKAGVP